MTSQLFKWGIMAPVAGTLLVLTACTDLEIEEVDSIIVEDTGSGQVAGDPEQLVEAVYNGLSTFTDQANTYSLFEHPSDELIPPTRGVDWGDNGVWRTLHAHTWDATHAQVLNAWNTLNSRIFNTAEILAANPNARQEAHGRFLQGYFMWHVLDLYGVVPFREFEQGVDELPRVIPRSEAIELAIDQVEASIDSLPSAGPGENIQGTKAAAYSMLTRMYLNKAVYLAQNPAGPYEHNPEDLQKVIDYADMVTEEGYSFDPNYFEIFEAGSDHEPILVSNQGTPENRWMMTLHYSQTPSGWNGFTTLADFYNSFDPADPRIGNEPTPDGTPSSGIGTGFLQGQQVNDQGNVLIDTRTQQPLFFTEEVDLAGVPTNAGVRVIKYHPARSGKYILIRYAESQLNKAEAQLRLGDAEGALETVNAMRATRGTPELSSIDLDGMLMERGFELYWEGLRRVDQIRFGTFTDTWDHKTVTDPTRVLFPIPQQALDSNPNLVQNPGY
ncbi:RagB/SusD family nutrient uptake outer membrane protein [Neolewinella xylanilytica]|nr:RagB/SusD family nutrient uptake outer membrane protein [Neolewinella xylanilytica]